MAMTIGKVKKTEESLCGYIDPDFKFVSINSLFKRPVDKIFYFTYKMTMHDQMTIVVTC